MNLSVPRLGYGDAIAVTESFDAPAGGTLNWGLGITGRCLRFGACFDGEAEVAGGASPGEFFEGLWKGDVVELFLAEEGGARYVEFNLAPNGAWWACGFSGIRERSPEFVVPPVSAHCGAVSELWIDVRGLPFGLAGARGNVSAIIGGEHFSVANLGGDQPDFHRPGDFIDLLVG